MDRENSIFIMVILIKGSMLMDCRRASGCISGKIIADMKVISNKACVMDMEYGIPKTIDNNTKVTISSTKNADMESIYGKIRIMFIKGILKMISGTDTENSTTKTKYNTRENGYMVKLNNKSTILLSKKRLKLKRARSKLRKNKIYQVYQD